MYLNKNIILMNGNSKMYLYLTKITNYKVQLLKVGYVDKHM